MKHEYLQLPSTGHPVPVEDINKFAKDGWRVVSMCCSGAMWVVLMEREKR